MRRMPLSAADSTLTQQLTHLLNGGDRRLVCGTSETVDYSETVGSDAAAALIDEGPHINTAVTAWPAALALGLMYLRTGDERVARTLAPPHTLPLIDTVRPDVLLLRTLARALVLFDDVLPCDEWVRAQVPVCVLCTLPLLYGMSDMQL
jgi:anaphase-promoting complex subunit 1